MTTGADVECGMLPGRRGAMDAVAQSLRHAVAAGHWHVLDQARRADRQHRPASRRRRHSRRHLALDGACALDALRCALLAVSFSFSFLLALCLLCRSLDGDRECSRCVGGNNQVELPVSDTLRSASKEVSADVPNSSDKAVLAWDVSGTGTVFTYLSAYLIPTEPWPTPVSRGFQVQKLIQVRACPRRFFWCEAEGRECIFLQMERCH